MKRFFTSSLRGAAFSAAAILAVLLSSAVRADLHVSQPVVKVGEVRRGAPLAQRFDFVNQGREAVEITGARASCGCLTPRLDKRTYQPGEAGSLLLEINTLSQSAGPHTWSVQLCCRTASRSYEMTLQITGQVVMEISVEPPVLTVFADRSVRHSIGVFDVRSKPLTVTAVHASSPHMKSSVLAKYDMEPVRLNELQLGGPVRMYEIQLEIADDYPEGRHDETVTIVTNDPLYRELRVPVTVVKRPRQRLSAAPNSVTLTAAPGQAIPSRLVLVRDNDGQGVEVERIVADDSAIVCQWAKGMNSPATVKISVDRSRLQGTSLNSAIHIHLSKPVREVLTIPVKCILPQSGLD